MSRSINIFKTHFSSSAFGSWQLQGSYNYKTNESDLSLGLDLIIKNLKKKTLHLLFKSEKNEKPKN